VKIDRFDDPVVVFEGPWSGTNEVYLTRWNGTSWGGLGPSADVGGISSAGGDVVFPHLLLDASGLPIVAWAQKANAQASSGSVRVSRWTGSSWVEFGGSISSNAAIDPSMARAPSGDVLLSFDEEGSPGSFHQVIVRWDGQAWSMLPAPRPGSTTDLAYLEIAVDRDNAIYAAWEEPIAPNNHEIYLRVLR
jgi:hypothetical protein